MKYIGENVILIKITILLDSYSLTDIYLPEAVEHGGVGLGARVAGHRCRAHAALLADEKHPPCSFSVSLLYVSIVTLTVRYVINR